MSSREEQLLKFLQKKQQVIRWIEMILKVHLDDDLCTVLKTGTVLCYLAKTIDDDLIPIIHDSTHPYKQLENLNFFIESCREIGVPLLKRINEEDFRQRVCNALRNS